MRHFQWIERNVQCIYYFLIIYPLLCIVSKAVHQMVIKELNLLLSHIFIYLCIIFHNLTI